MNKQGVANELMLRSMEDLDDSLSNVSEDLKDVQLDIATFRKSIKQWIKEIEKQ